MTTAFDQLYVWMTMDGKRVVDLDEQEIDLLQFETQSVLWEFYGINPLSKEYDAEKEKFIENLMYGKDGNGWIIQAKKLGLIRKRTKQEREAHNSEELAFLR